MWHHIAYLDYSPAGAIAGCPRLVPIIVPLLTKIPFQPSTVVLTTKCVLVQDVEKMVPSPVAINLKKPFTRVNIVPRFRVQVV